ncbi:MAG: bifunctional folylpolyglutamate synthase/dihydrofolate synthase [Clostridiales bacterium]|nr:bifunctional folylpolyglutamate synthase/dihydrofolate synthase [Clostridiales bacterium]
MRNAQQVIDAIHGSYQTGSKQGFRHVSGLLEHMGVSMKTPLLHIAGTNGKGSTCAMLSSVLQAAGYRVGLYTSPFLQHYQERIRLNGVPLTDALMVRYGNPLVEAAEALRAQGEFVTPFEMGTALALAAFDGEACDFAIVEVGMGGRLDPTNVIRPIACGIAAIGLDHMGFLGDTLEAIAGEKAGIIKHGVPVVCYPAQESVRRVFAEAAEKQCAPLTQLDECAILDAQCDLHGSTVTYQLGTRWEKVRIGLAGQYQQRNAMLALALVEELRRQGYTIPEAAVRQGLASTVWPARLEWAGNVLIDGAHNPQGVQALTRYVDCFLAGRKRVLLTGVLSDKLQTEMLSQMVHLSREIVTVTPDTPRALSAAEYAARLNDCGAHATPAATLAEGLALALSLAGEDGVVIAAGSLYFAGALRTELQLPWR